MRYFCGVPRSCPLAGLSGDLGWVPGVVWRDLKCIRLFNQIVKMERSCLTHQILQSEWAECAPNSWAENVRNIIYSIGKQESWNNLSPVNVKDTKNSLLNWYMQAWKTELRSKSKLSTYAEINEEYGAEGYIKCNLDKARRSLIAQLCFGILNLEIEVARYAKVPCKLCESGNVESKYHFLFHCTALRTERIGMYNEFTELLNYSLDACKLPNPTC